MEVSARSEDHTHSPLIIVNYNTLHVRLDEDVEIWKLSTLKLRVDIRVGGVLALPVGADVALGMHRSVDGVEDVVVWKLWPSQLAHGRNEVIL